MKHIRALREGDWFKFVDWCPWAGHQGVFARVYRVDPAIQLDKWWATESNIWYSIEGFAQNHAAKSTLREYIAEIYDAETSSLLELKYYNL